MPTTNPSNIVYPDGASPYNYLTDLAALAQSVQNALNKQGNMFHGTDSERIAYTTKAKNGTLWSNSDGDMKTYQFRAGTWYPEYEFVPLDITSKTNQNFAPAEYQPVGVHVTSFGRMATLSGSLQQKTVFSWQKGTVWNLGTIPLRVAPPGPLNNMSSVWSPQDSKLIAVSAQIRGYVTTPAGAGLFQLVPAELFRNMSSSSGATIELPGLTWAIPQPKL